MGNAQRAWLSLLDKYGLQAPVDFTEQFKIFKYVPLASYLQPKWYGRWKKKNSG
jgi:hypothetical protein